VTRFKILLQSYLGMCDVSRDLIKRLEISDNISLTVLNRDIPAMED